MAGASFLDAGSLAAIHRAQADGWATQLALSGQTCTILRPTQTRNAVTGYVETFAPAGTVACVVRTSGIAPRDQQIGTALRAQTAAEILVPAGTDVRKDDRIGDAAGIVYEVVGQPIAAPNAATLTVSVVATT